MTATITWPGARESLTNAPKLTTISFCRAPPANDAFVDNRQRSVGDGCPSGGLYYDCVTQPDVNSTKPVSCLPGQRMFSEIAFDELIDR